MIHVKNFEKLGRKKRKRKSLNIIPSLIEIGRQDKNVFHRLCSRALVRWGMGSLAPPECWASKKQNRKRNRQSITIRPPGFKNQTTALCSVLSTWWCRVRNMHLAQRAQI